MKWISALRKLHRGAEKAFLSAGEAVGIVR